MSLSGAGVIYFDFNRATLDSAVQPRADDARSPMSCASSRHGASASKDARTTLGEDTYNQDLSHSTGRGRESRAGGILHRRGTTDVSGIWRATPVETNETIAGRARNRRVELVRDCTAK